MSKYLRVIFQDPKKPEQKAHLHFRLKDHPFMNKWKEVLNKSSHLPILDGGVFYGNCVNSREGILEVMLRSIETVNRHAPEQKWRIEMTPHLDVDQLFLDELHKEFERLSADLDFFAPNCDEVSAALIDLNAAIHQMECFVGIPKDEKVLPYFGLDVNFVNGEIYDLEPEDYEYFTLNRSYGEMYLNYNTVGVPVYYAFIHGEKQPPVPQRTYKGDITISFNPCAPFEKWDELDGYLKNNFGWDVRDKALALGYISMGTCVEAERLEPQDIADLVKRHRQVAGVELLDSI